MCQLQCTHPSQSHRHLSPGLLNSLLTGFLLPRVCTHNLVPTQQPESLLEHKSAYSSIPDPSMVSGSLRIKVYKIQCYLISLCRSILSLFPHWPPCSSHAGLLAGPQQARTLPPWAVVQTASSAHNAHLPSVCLDNSLLPFRSLLKSDFSKTLSVTNFFKFTTPSTTLPSLASPLLFIPSYFLVFTAFIIFSC